MHEGLLLNAFHELHHLETSGACKCRMYGTSGPEVQAEGWSQSDTGKALQTEKSAGTSRTTRLKATNTLSTDLQVSQSFDRSRACLLLAFLAQRAEVHCKHAPASRTREHPQECCHLPACCQSCPCCTVQITRLQPCKGAQLLDHQGRSCCRFCCSQAPMSVYKRSLDTEAYT